MLSLGSIDIENEISTDGIRCFADRRDDLVQFIEADLLQSLR